MAKIQVHFEIEGGYSIYDDMFSLSLFRRLIYGDEIPWLTSSRFFVNHIELEMIFCEFLKWKMINE